VVGIPSLKGRRGKKPKKKGMDLKHILLIGVIVSQLGCDARSKPEPKATRQRLSPVQIFDLRTKCQAIVDKDVEDYAIGVVGNALRADTKSHYNPLTNHCYAEVLVTKNFNYNWPKTPANYRSDALYDAQTKDLLLIANQEGEKRYGNDFRTSGMSFTTFDKASDEIQLLMTQENEEQQP
jgi:hypothetical protein